MTTDLTQTVTTNRWKRRLAILVLALLTVVVGTLIWFFSRRAETETPAEVTLPSSHPLFGAIHESSATDVMEMPQIRGPTGLLPRNPIYLVVGSGLLEWGAADVHPAKPSGYLYFLDPMSTMKSSNVWAFAVCKQSGLADLTEKDFKADFCESDEIEKGRGAFGTNWMQYGRRGNAILVREGQVILARHSSQPTRIYALEMTKQNRGNLRVRYLEVIR